MKTHALDIEALQALCCQSVNIVYNTDAADVLTLQMKTAEYADIGIAYGDRLTVTEGERVVFSGIVASGAAHSAQAGTGETINLEAYSDFHILERTAFCRLNSKGEAIYPSINRSNKFAALNSFLAGVFDYAKGWHESSLNSSFSCTVSRSIPVPEGNGTTSCGSLMQEALRWTPDAIMVQRYSESGDSLQVLKIDALEHLTLPKTALITSIALQARPEVVPPVCALVGGDNYIIPSGADVRAPGAFIYPVPISKDTQRAAGSAPDSQKMTLKGIAVPERTVNTNSEAVYDSTVVTEGSRMQKFLRYFFPKYRDYLPHCGAAAPLLTVVPVEDLQEDAPGEDEDSVQPPANYSDPLSWGSGDGYDNCFVLVEGSFTASAQNRKNLRGLKWCKANLSINLSLSQEQYAELPPELKPSVDELFPGRNRRKKQDGDAYVSHKLVNLKLDCVLINSRKRIFDTATNQPCTTDAEYNEDAELTITDYRQALQDYYTASRTIWHEGNIDLLHDGSLQPELLTGRTVTLAGKREEWRSMNAVIRSVRWSFQEHTLSLSVGGRDINGFGDILERRLLAKTARRETEQRMTVPFDVADIEEQDAIEADMSVSPSISASVSGAVSGSYYKPFTLHEIYEGENVIVRMTGGTLNKGGKIFVVPDADNQIERGEPSGDAWQMGKALKLKWEKIAGEWKYSIKQEE